MATAREFASEDAHGRAAPRLRMTSSLDMGTAFQHRSISILRSSGSGFQKEAALFELSMVGPSEGEPLEAADDEAEKGASSRAEEEEDDEARDQALKVIHDPTTIDEAIDHEEHGVQHRSMTIQSGWREFQRAA